MPQIACGIQRAIDCLTFSNEAVQFKVLVRYEGTCVERDIVPSLAVRYHFCHLNITPYVHFCDDVEIELKKLAAMYS